MKASSSLQCLASLVLLSSLTACVSVEKAAPPVATLRSIPSPAAKPKLEDGRCLYVGKCTKCHSPEPIAKHDVSDWNEDILPTMAKKAKLTPEECEALRAYVLAVCQQPPQI